MSLSMYQVSVPVFVRQLTALSAILKKAEAFADSIGASHASLIEGRLAPDMHPLPRQIQIATDAVKGGVARLAQVEVPSFADTETTFSELQDRIAKTIAFMQSVPAEAMDGAEARVITLPIGGNEMKFSGQQYLLNLVIPNFFFHVTTAYGILRQGGVNIGKLDYLGGV